MLVILKILLEFRISAPNDPFHLIQQFGLNDIICVVIVVKIPMSEKNELFNILDIIKINFSLVIKVLWILKTTFKF